LKKVQPSQRFILQQLLLKHYPSLQRHLVNEAIEDALKKHSCYNRIVLQIIADLNNICLENVSTQYGSRLYKQRGGIVTADNHSVSLANITVHYILQPIADILEQTELFCRFIDDIVWITDSESTNIGIRSALNTVFKNTGLELTFRQICTSDDSGSVEFLDSITELQLTAFLVCYKRLRQTYIYRAKVHSWFITPSSVNFLNQLYLEKP